MEDHMASRSQPVLTPKSAIGDAASSGVVRERPILFSAPMVRAILDGRKTQTRRAIRPQPNSGPNGKVVNLGGAEWALIDGIMSDLWRCPYGVPGDLLWVKENHYLTDDGGFEIAVYAEDGDAVRQHLKDVSRVAAQHRLGEDWRKRHTKLRPSIHMPRWASRITLRVTDVRVERLNEIRHEDCWAEGVVCPIHGTVKHTCCAGLMRGYRDLWNSINGPGSWDANPWVWVVAFEVITPSSLTPASQGDGEAGVLGQHGMPSKDPAPALTGPDAIPRPSEA